MYLIHQLLERYIGVIEARGYPIGKYLNPRLTRSQIAKQSRELPFTPPPEIFQLYEWHDGVNEACRISLFRDNQFLSLEQALEEYETLCTYYVGERIDYGVDLSKCFPFASFEGSVYVLPAVSQTLKPEHERPVISVFEGVDVYFRDLPTMIETCIAWYVEGVYQVDDYSVDQKRELEIWQRLNPGIFN